MVNCISIFTPLDFIIFFLLHSNHLLSFLPTISKLTPVLTNGTICKNETFSD